MIIRVDAIEVSHWRALYDAAYLRHLVGMPDVELVAIQDFRRRSRRETSCRGGEPANLHGLPTDASDYSPRLRRGARAAPADGRDRPRPARSELSLPDGEADGDQRVGGGGGSCQSGPARCVCRPKICAINRSLSVTPCSPQNRAISSSVCMWFLTRTVKIRCSGGFR